MRQAYVPYGITLGLKVYYLHKKLANVGDFFSHGTDKQDKSRCGFTDVTVSGCSSLNLLTLTHI